LTKRLHIGHCLPLKLTQPLTHTAPNESRITGPTEGKERLAVLEIHHILAPLPATNAHKRVFIVFIVGAVEAKQTPVGLTTQGNNIFRAEVFDLIKRKENGDRRIRYFKSQTNQLKSFDESPAIRVKLNRRDVESS
jgi:hypothetical protein